MNAGFHFSCGDVVEIVAGQFAGSKGTIAKVDDQRVLVMLEGIEPLLSTDFKSSGGTRATEFSIRVARHQIKLLK